MVPFGWGIFRDVSKTFVLLSGQPAGAFFSAKNIISRNFGHGHFSKNEFASKTSLLGRLFGEMSHKSDSYGPYGPF